MSDESDFKCADCGYEWCAIPPSDCPECRQAKQSVEEHATALRVETRKRSSQCECCASPLGDEIKLHHTTRIVCLRCLGFMARWLIELEREEPKA